MPALAELLQPSLEQHGLHLVRSTAGSTEVKEFYARTAFDLEVSGPLPELLALPERLGRVVPIVEVRGIHVEQGGTAYRARIRCWTYAQGPGGKSPSP